MASLLRFILYIVGSVIILRFFARIIKSIINKTFELVGINKRISLRVFQILGIISCICCFHLFFSGVQYYGFMGFIEKFTPEVIGKSFSVLFKLGIISIISSIFLTIGEENLKLYEYNEYKGSMVGGGLFLSGVAPFVFILFAYFSQHTPNLGNISSGTFLPGLGIYALPIGIIVSIIMLILIILLISLMIISFIAFLLTPIFSIWGIINMIRGFKKPAYTN